MGELRLNQKLFLGVLTVAGGAFAGGDGGGSFNVGRLWNQTRSAFLPAVESA